MGTMPLPKDGRWGTSVFELGDLYWTEVEALNSHKLKELQPPNNSSKIGADPEMYTMESFALAGLIYPSI